MKKEGTKKYSQNEEKTTKTVEFTKEFIVAINFWNTSSRQFGRYFTWQNFRLELNLNENQVILLQ